MTFETLSAGLLLLIASLSVTATSVGLHTRRSQGLEAGRLRDSRPRRAVSDYLAPAVGFPGDQEYGGRFAPLNKRPFGSLFNMKGFGKRNEIEEQDEIIPEEDNAVPTRLLQNVLSGGFQLDRQRTDKRGDIYGKVLSQDKRQFGTVLGGGYKSGKKRGYGTMLGGGYKFGKRGLGGVLSGGYKFGKRGFGGVLGGGYKFGKRGEEQTPEHETIADENEGFEMAKRPWGNLFNKGFQFGKRDNSLKMADIYRAILSRGVGNGGNGVDRDAAFQDGGRIMQGAISMAKRLFGNVLGGGYKLG